MSRLLEIQPKELRFTVELKKQSSCSVRVTNITNYYVAFKVKTTSPKRYCVRPNVGIVMPNSSSDFTVTMQILKTGDMDCKDKFLIQSTTVSAETTDEDITASMFVKDSGNYVEEKKLKVVLSSPIDSPTLSPISGNLRHGLGRETSFQRDQSVNGAEIPSKHHTTTQVTEEREEPVLVNIKESKVIEDKKLKPVKSVLFKLDADLEELKLEKDLKDLEPSKYVEELKLEKNMRDLEPPRFVEELKPAKRKEEPKPAFVIEEVNATNGEAELQISKDEEELKPAKNLTDTKRAKGEEIVVGPKSFHEELKPEKEVHLKNSKEREDCYEPGYRYKDLELVKDVEDIKYKLSEFELKLSKADFAISKLMMERNSNIEEIKVLQEKFVKILNPAELSKRGIKTVQVGFPLLFVCMVALTSIVLGYRLHA